MLPPSTGLKDSLNWEVEFFLTSFRNSYALPKTKEGSLEAPLLYV
jgi:hypothetical protein